MQPPCALRCGHAFKFGEMGFDVRGGARIVAMIERSEADVVAQFCEPTNAFVDEHVTAHRSSIWNAWCDEKNFHGVEMLGVDVGNEIHEFVAGKVVELLALLIQLLVQLDTNFLHALVRRLGTHDDVEILSLSDSNVAVFVVES